MHWFLCSMGRLDWGRGFRSLEKAMFTWISIRWWNLCRICMLRFSEASSTKWESLWFRCSTTMSRTKWVDSSERLCKLWTPAISTKPSSITNSSSLSKTSNLCGGSSSLPACCNSTEGWNRPTTSNTKDVGSCGFFWKDVVWKSTTTPNTLESISHPRSRLLIWKAIHTTSSMRMGWWERDNLKDRKIAEISSLVQPPKKMNIMAVLSPTGGRSNSRTSWGRTTRFRKRT